MTKVVLRELEDGDLDHFFAHLQDPEAVWMAAFTPKDPADRAAFDAHWRRIRADAPGVSGHRSGATDARACGR